MRLCHFCAVARMALDCIALYNCLTLLYSLQQFGFFSRSPASNYAAGIISPGRDLAHFAVLEDRFCKDFNCCGLNLENLHDLLQHFEENHVHVESDVEDEDELLPFQFEPVDDMDMDMDMDGDADQQPHHLHFLKNHLRSMAVAAAQTSAVSGGGEFPAIALSDIYSEDYRIVNRPAASQSAAFDTSVVRKSRMGGATTSNPSARFRKSKPSVAAQQNGSNSTTVPYHFDGPTQVISDVDMDEDSAPTHSSVIVTPPQPDTDHGLPPLPVEALPRAPAHPAQQQNHQQQQAQQKDQGAQGQQPHEEKDDRPYKCKMPGCVKAYKNPGGLKYHMQHGHCEDTGDPEMNNIIHKPYQWCGHHSVHN
ncbi:hypothetical protein BJ742DRAFT_65280 [Cladochytrium replicatum]|nr:hypothetical protein BJ742DRAFT_65280 [Cladochytrium replicatum]